MGEKNVIEDLAGQVTKLAKDSLYLAVGLTVVTVQKLQEQAEELRRAVENRLNAGKEQVDGFNDRIEPQLKAIDERITEVETRLRELVDQLGDRLPEPAEKALDRAFEAATSARAQLRERWLGDTAAA